MRLGEGSDSSRKTRRMGCAWDSTALRQPCIVQLQTLITGATPAAYPNHWSSRSSWRTEERQDTVLFGTWEAVLERVQKDGNSHLVQAPHHFISGLHSLLV